LGLNSRVQLILQCPSPSAAFSMEFYQYKQKSHLRLSLVHRKYGTK
ncbi:hypothetical protein TNCT_295971, partial [Trichonephila clavata]